MANLQQLLQRADAAGQGNVCAAQALHRGFARMHVFCNDQLIAMLKGNARHIELLRNYARDTAAFCLHTARTRAHKARAAAAEHQADAVFRKRRAEGERSVDIMPGKLRGRSRKDTNIPSGPRCNRIPFFSL